MQWLLDNWIWILFGVGFVAMHMFGHGGHGAHGGHGKRQNGASQMDQKLKPDAPSLAGWGRIAGADTAGGAEKQHET